MERLTEKDEQGNWCLKGVPWKCLYLGEVITATVFDKIYEALWKLMEYEDTDLTPEEIEQLKDKVTISKMENVQADDWIPVEERLPKLGEKLMEYEDTDLTPEEIEQLKDKVTISKMENVQADDWIPVEERLPKLGEPVWATVKHSEWISDYDTDWLPEEKKTYHPESYGVYEAEYIGEGIWQYSDDYNEWVYCDPVEKEKRNLANVYDTVTAWQPLPEPYHPPAVED